MAKVTIRIHRQHDMDLMSIYRNKSYHIAKEIKKALIAYASEKEYVPQEVCIADEAEGYVPTSVVVHISLSEKKEDERKALELLSHIKYGYRCSFIKAVFRSFLPYLPLLAYSDDSGFVMARAKSPVKVAMDSFNKTENIAKTKIEVVDPESELKERTEEELKQAGFEVKEINVSSAVSPIETNISEEDNSDLDALFSQMDKLGR